ncbi:hypothetical protein M5K25_027613 [Dendrobium thyrsiflorum]|uniref:Uncharacterized protein n=1 Tax=Dendrobium thyrsiflorum TaxID=117978 RepID=A0ABD0TUA9_DENTH
MGFLFDPFFMILIVGGGSPGSHTGCHAQVYFSFFSLIISMRLWPPALFSFPPRPFSGGSPNAQFGCHTPMFTEWDSLSLGRVLLTSVVSGRWNLFFFSKLGRLGQTKIQGWLLLAPGQAHWKDGLKTVAELEVQHFFFSSASWLASLQMTKSQHCYSQMQSDPGTTSQLDGESRVL